MNNGIKRNSKLALLVALPSLPALWLGGWLVWIVTFLLYFCMIWGVLRTGSLNLWSLIMTLGITEEEYAALTASEMYKKNNEKMANWLFLGGRQPRYSSQGIVVLKREEE